MQSRVCRHTHRIRRGRVCTVCVCPGTSLTPGLGCATHFQPKQPNKPGSICHYQGTGMRVAWQQQEGSDKGPGLIPAELQPTEDSVSVHAPRDVPCLLLSLGIIIGGEVTD